MSKKKKVAHPRTITLNTDFVPCAVAAQDEFFRNGIFVFNITKLKTYIEAHRDAFATSNIDVAYYHTLQANMKLKDDYIQQADLARPVILAEITPDRYEMGMASGPTDYYARGYNLIDGHHRVEKAYRLRIMTLQAYIVRMEQHINFLAEGYEEYIEYWNGKFD